MAVQIDKEKCTGCGSCMGVCPVEALEINDGKVQVSDACVDCGACVDACPVEALALP